MRVELYGCRAGKGHFSSNEELISLFLSNDLANWLIWWLSIENDMREVVGLNSVGPGTWYLIAAIVDNLCLS